MLSESRRLRVLFAGLLYLQFTHSLAAEKVSNEKSITIQFLSNFLKSPQNEQPVRDSFQRLSINLDWIYKNDILGKIELEQTRDGDNNPLIINQFYAKNSDTSKDKDFLWGLGFMPVPLNDLNVYEDEIFLYIPYFHRDFFSQRQMIESGFYIGYKLYNFSLQAGGFQRLKSVSPSEGQTYSDIPPHFIQLQWRNLIGQISFTYYNEKDSFLPEKPTLGLSLMSGWKKLKINLEAWKQYRKQTDQVGENNIGGYLHIHYPILERLNIGLRYDYFERLSLKDAWQNPINNHYKNFSAIVRFYLTPDFFIQGETVAEQKTIENDTDTILSGSLLQATYSMEF